MIVLSAFTYTQTPFCSTSQAPLGRIFRGLGTFSSVFLRKRGDFSGSACPSPTPCFPHDTRCFAELYWTAPELLRLPEAPRSGTPKGDVYSFAILMTELIHHQNHGPFADLNEMPDGKAESLFGRLWSCGLAFISYICRGQGGGSGTLAFK